VRKSHRSVETVYNVEVEKHQTYFIAETGWGWSVWAHNAAATHLDVATGWPWL
jgi:hypothetical protein